MPITSSAKKAHRQTLARTDRKKPYKSRMKSAIKKFIAAVKKDKKEAEKLFPETCSAIDTACKKHIIHQKNADRKKSRLAKMLKEEEAPKKKATTKKEKEAVEA